MSTLFTVSQSWFDHPSIYENKVFAVGGDAILLIQDGVLALQSPIALASFTAKCLSNGIAVYALSDDCQLRGIESKCLDVELVDYAGFVQLVSNHQKQLAW